MASTVSLRVKSNTDRRYKEAVENASSFNAQLSRERRLRLPFLDSQTGVAQNHSQLLHTIFQRLPGRTEQELLHYPQRRWHMATKRHFPEMYSDEGKSPAQFGAYPERRWRAKKRPFPQTESRALPSERLEARGGSSNRLASLLSAPSQDIHTITSVENPAAEEIRVPVKEHHHVAEEYYEDWDQLSEPPDAGEIDRRDTDSSDYEDSYSKRKKKKGSAKKATKGGGGRGKRKAQNAEKAVENEEDKPYACELIKVKFLEAIAKKPTDYFDPCLQDCGVRYKTRPGLSYHVTHHHNKSEEDDSQDGRAYTVSPKPAIAPPPMAAAAAASSSGSSAAAPLLTAAEPALPGGSKRKENSKYCDFCLGDEMENKKTGQKEELVSCADCGRSGHPTCLQFTANMIISVGKYPWQCIECKSCSLCGTSDNDDQLLFCDDCDRGYHMYCLTPPFSEPPEGSWSCHLCIRDFYGGQKPPSMQ